MKKKATVEVYKDNRGEWRWTLKHGNGKTLAASSEGFASKAGAWRNLKRTREAMAEIIS